MPDLDLPDMPNIPRMPKNMVSGFISDLTKPSVAGVGGDAPGADEVSSHVETAGNEELVSASSSGRGDSSPSSVSEPAAAGQILPSTWVGRDPNEGFRRPNVAPAVLEDLPVAFDDASMN